MPLLHTRKRPDERWERICRSCGLCCYQRTLTANGVRIDLSRPCPYLDTSTGRCRVYHRRFAAGALCSKVNILHALFGRRMPLTCGYVQRYRRWMHE
ncbi:MAG: hypothetical protein ACOCY8_07890 [Spirochaetota bacterium]